MTQSEREQQEFWRSLDPLLEQILFYLGADIAIDALRSGDRRRMDHFFRRHLGREATPHELLALYKILTRPGERWRSVKWPATPNYVGSATWRRGRDIRNKWEGDGILTPEQSEKEARAARELDRHRTRIPSPDRQLQRRETMRFRAKVLKRALAGVRQKGSERDSMILDLLEAGRTPAQAISELGLQWSAWEALRRKVERRGRKEVEILRSGVSSRRVSAG